MSDLEPPEIPMDSQGIAGPIQKEEKKGFFAKLFSKKTDEDSPVVNTMSSNASPGISAPELELPSSFSSSEINSSPGFAPIVLGSKDDTSESDIHPAPKGKKSKAAKIKESKAKGKAAKSSHSKKISKIDESGQFDWTRDIKEQEILIHDNNRFNKDILPSGKNIVATGNNDIDSLMKQAEDHVNNGMLKVDENSIVSEHQEVYPSIEPIDIDMDRLEPLPELGAGSASIGMPSIDAEHAELFNKVSSNHSKLRKKLSKVVSTSSRLKKDEVTKLLNDYDESVEKHIENKQLELSSKKKHLEKLENHLKNKEKAVDTTHKKVLELHGKLKNREQELNDLVAETVDKELARRLKEDKAALRDEIKNTEKLNAELARKSKSLDETKSKLEKEYQKKIDAEQKKLNDMQSLYEKKLAQLTAERTKFEADKKELEARRSDALKLINQAHEASKEIDHINQLKAYIDRNKQKVETELSEDKELKNAILNAEKALIEEKKNLDNLIFSKYIENKLKNIKPETLNNSEDWRTELNSNPLYKQINQCKTLLSQRKVNEAKSLYNQIRQAYESAQVSRREKEALYVAIRELYNDIQLKIVESQMSK